MVMMNDQQFIDSIRHKTISFEKTRGLPVGNYLIIANEYWIFNRELKTPIIKAPFHSIIDAHTFCEKLVEIYGNLLHILIDKWYAEVFFQITRYTVENGIILNEQIRSLDNLSTIKRSDLAFILDN